MNRTRHDPELLLRRWWEQGPPRPLGALLSLASLGYRAGMVAREGAYRLGLLPTGQLACPVVSVGNITLGGSGKTPTVELAVRTLKELGAEPAVVSRGYGRQSRGVHVVADSGGVRLMARQAGDEPLLLAERLPGTPVVVGENRFEAGRVAVERCGASVVVVDDGFQHRTVKKDLEVLAVNGRAPWGNARLFPRGTLREPLAALARADLVVVTNAREPAEVEAVSEAVRRHRGRAPVLSAAFSIERVTDMRSGTALDRGGLRGKRLLAFCGLASPRGFLDTLAGAGVDVAGFVEFPDHFWFSRGDLAELDRQAQILRAEGLVTSEKDWMRIRDLPLPPVPLWVPSVRLVLDSGQQVWTKTLGRLLSASSAPR